jgi:hypothetical protein
MISYTISYTMVYQMLNIWIWAGQTSLDVCLWCHVTWTTTQSIQFLVASGARSQKKLQQILDPTVGLGAGCSKSTCGSELWKDLSSSNLCGASCGIAQKEGARARGADTLRRKSDRAWAKGASATKWMALTECYIVSNIKPDMLWHDLRYQTSVRPSISYTISKCVCSISKAWNLDVGYPVLDVRYRRWVTLDIEQSDLQYRTPSISTYDIEGATWISNEHSILKSLISNVTFDKLISKVQHSI